MDSIYFHLHPIHADYHFFSFLTWNNSNNNNPKKDFEIDNDSFNSNEKLNDNWNFVYLS